MCKSMVGVCNEATWWGCRSVRTTVGHTVNHASSSMPTCMAIVVEPKNDLPAKFDAAA